MSSATKVSSKDKKVGKESQKASSKLSGIANAGSGVPASVYNPLSGTFHILESGQAAFTSPIHMNGRFRNIDETDDHNGSVGSGVEYDSVSNNGSSSVESKDHKEKTSNSSARLETVSGVDNDKREKIRLKNERKHQRQKEKRAQELHEKCSGYLMSRKLEALAQQLVAMGFSQERAMMALMSNEGKLEESVSWLFDAGEEADKATDQNLPGGNFKIDISEELSRIAEMEIRFKCTKQEVERTVVACEGDIEKAAESLKSLKPDPSSTSPKLDESGDHPTAINGKPPTTASQNIVRSQPKSIPPPILQQRRDDKDFNYVKASLPVLGSSETGTKTMQPLKRVPQKSEWMKPQQSAVATEKRWANGGSNPSVSYPIQSLLQVTIPAAKSESNFSPGVGEYKNIQHGMVQEPVIVMQRPQSANAKQVSATSISSSPPGSAGWYTSNGVGIVNSNGTMPSISSSNGLGSNVPSSGQLFSNLHYQQQQLIPSSNLGDSPSTGMSLWNRTGASPTLAAASSLGLFSGMASNGSSGSSSPVDWSRPGSMTQFDYTNIDWSLDPSPAFSRSNRFWIGSGSLMNNTQAYDMNSSGLGAKLAMRSSPNVNGLSIPVLPDSGVSNGDKATAGSHEWTSPFEGKDLFTLPRQFVTSPSM